MRESWRVQHTLLSLWARSQVSSLACLSPGRHQLYLYTSFFEWIEISLFPSPMHASHLQNLMISNLQRTCYVWNCINWLVWDDEFQSELVGQRCKDNISALWGSDYSNISEIPVNYSMLPSLIFSSIVSCVCKFPEQHFNDASLCSSLLAT